LILDNESLIVEGKTIPEGRCICQEGEPEDQTGTEKPDQE
jgi:hypothetical protein